MNSPFMIDTAVSTLFAIAAMEHPAITAEEPPVFAPPPKTPFSNKGSSGKPRSLKTQTTKPKLPSKGNWYRRSSKAIEQAEKALIGDPPDVPAVTHGAVALIGLTIKGVVFLLETGVRVTARVVNHTLAG